MELDARAQEGEPTLVFLRTLQGLEHGTSYAVAFSGLSENDSLILPSDGFRALRDNISTDNQGIEFQRKNYEDMFDSFWRYLGCILEMFWTEQPKRKELQRTMHPK